MHFFVQGDSGIGKSYLIRELLCSYANCIEGFTVQRLHNEDGKLSFCADVFDGHFKPLDSENIKNYSNVFLSPDAKKVEVLNEIIRQVEINIQKDSCKLVLLDEIGGFELSSSIFMDTLYRILNSGKPCIGVLKSRKNLDRTLKKHSIIDSLELEYSCLVKTIIGNGDIHTMGLDNKYIIKSELSFYLESVIGKNFSS